MFVKHGLSALLMASIISSWAISMPALGLTIHVPDEQPTIQAGIDAAASGDTVLVAAGVYTGPGNRDLNPNGKAIVIRSESGPESTVLDAQEEARGVIFDTAETEATVLEGFTIKHGFTPWPYRGFGVYCNSASPTLRDCVIIENAGANRGAGVYCTNQSAPAIIDCTLSQNVGEGGGVYADSSSSPTIRRCIITENFGATGAGLLIVDGSALIEDCVISGNEAESGAGLSILGESSVLLDECILTGNDARAGWGGGISVQGTGATVVLHGCTVASNHSLEEGGGIFISGSAVEAERTILWDNCGDDAFLAGGAVSFFCCTLDPSEISGSGDITYEGQQVVDDPLFCDPIVCNSNNLPSTEGDYTIRSDSPCLPKNSPCGELIGALGIGCTPTVFHKETWGRVKAKHLE